LGAGGKACRPTASNNRFYSDDGVVGSVGGDGAVGVLAFHFRLPSSASRPSLAFFAT